jgi:hypothetical protein
MLRCGGRLQHANVSETARFLVLLQSGDKLTIERIKS